MNKSLILLGFVIVGGFIFLSVMNKPSRKELAGKNVVTKEKATISKSGYIVYDSTEFQKQVDKKRVLFFHAKWCPTCKVADKEFTENSDKIPSDIILFKTDYDTEKDLIALYGVTYQHTFVYVDSQGNELKKWNGGGVAELVNNTSSL